MYSHKCVGLRGVLVTSKMYCVVHKTSYNISHVVMTKRNAGAGRPNLLIKLWFHFHCGPYSTELIDRP